jgi:hypothetical protein
MAADIDLFVEDADHIRTAVVSFHVKDQMMAASEATIVRHYPVRLPATVGIFTQLDKGIEQPGNIDISLFLRPIDRRVVLDIVEIRLCRRA